MNRNPGGMDYEAEKLIFIKFESKTYPIFIPKEIVTIDQLKVQFCQTLMQSGVIIDPVAYQFQDKFGQRVLGEEERITNILREFTSQFLQFIKIFVIEQHQEQHLEQNLNQLLEQHQEQNQEQHLEQHNEQHLEQLQEQNFEQQMEQNLVQNQEQYQEQYFVQHSGQYQKQILEQSLEQKLVQNKQQYQDQKYRQKQLFQQSLEQKKLIQYQQQYQRQYLSQEQVFQQSQEQNLEWNLENQNRNNLKYLQEQNDKQTFIFLGQKFLKFPVTYNNYEVQVKIPDQSIKIKDLKKEIIKELKSQKIIVNEHFCGISNLLIEWKCIYPIYLYNYEKIVLIDYKEWQLKKRNICLVDQQQIKNALSEQKQEYVKQNLRIAIECQKLKEKSCFKMFPFSQTLNFSRIYFIGPKQTPYQNGIYELISKIPEDYPYEPPQFYFNTNIYHPNILNSKIALDELENTWNPVSTFSSAIQFIISYLKEPNLKYIIDQEAGDQYLNDKDSFYQKAEAFRNKFAQFRNISKTAIGEIPLYNQLSSTQLDEFFQWIKHWQNQSE